MAAPAAFTATAVSLDQVTLTWTPEAGSLIDIERSLDNVTWNRVYHCPSDDGDGFGTAEAKLYNHEPSTLYYYRARHYSGAGVASSYSATTSDTTSAAGTTYYVRTDGNDGNAGTTDSSGGAFLTIQYAIGQMSSGDEVLIGDGTYLEASGEGASGASSPLTVLEACLGFAAKSSGTEALPYVIRKNPNNTDRPILDGEHVSGGNQSRKSGIHLDDTDHIHIRGLEIKNCLAYGIHTYDSDGAGATWPPAGANEGAVVEGCYIHHIGGGDNDAGVWHSANGSAVVRNTLFRDIYGNSAASRFGASIYGFGMYRCLYEFNQTDKVGLTSGASNFGISCKDYFVDASGNSLPSVCVRYNYSDTTGAGISLWSQPGAPSGSAAFYNNLSITAGGGDQGHGRFTANGVGGTPVVDPILLKNNTIVCSSSSIPAIQFTDATDFQFEGNIISGTKRNALQGAYSTHTLTACDRNIYLDSFSSNLVELSRYSTNLYYADLAAWQAAPVTAFSSVVSPDANSDTSTTALTYNDAAAGDYTLKAGSPAIGAMADGSDAGVYQFGVENIGIFVAESSIVAGSTIEANGLTFEIDFSTAITDAGTILPAHFTIAGSTVSAAVLTSSTLVTLTISSTAIEQGAAAPLITYTQPGTGLQEGGVDIPTFETAPVNNSTVDTVAPVLSSPLGTPTGSSTATGSVTTDEGDGWLYYTVTTGTTDTSGNILAGSSQAVSATGSQLVSATGLTGGTNYYFHFLHQDAATNKSVISNSALFTTDAAVGPVLFAAQINSAGSSLLLTFSEAVQESGSESAVTLSTGNTLSAPTGGGTSTLTYALSPYAVAGDVVTVSFAGGANVIEPNGGGTDTAAFTDEAVTNASTETYPVVLASPAPTIDATGTVLTIYTNDILVNLSTPQYTPFSLTGGYTFSNALFTGTGATFTVTPEVQQGDVVTLAFTQAGGEFTSTTSGLGLQTFSSRAVTNNSTVVTVPPVFTSAPAVIKTTVQGHTIRQTIDKTGVVYGVRLPAGAGPPSSSQVKAGQDSTGSAALEAKSVAAVAGQSCSSVFSTGEKNTTYDYYIVAEDSVPNLQGGAQVLTATTANLLFNGSGGQGLRPDEDSKRKVKMMWDSKKKER